MVNLRSIILLVGLLNLIVACSNDRNEMAGPLIITDSLAAGTTTRSYSQTLSADRTSGVESWTISAGNLPPGLTLSSSGEIQGTPTMAGVYEFSIVVTDARNLSATSEQTLTIEDPEFGIITSNIDQDGDGSLDIVVTHTFVSANGQLIDTRSEDIGTRATWSNSYTYDNDGYLVRDDYIEDGVLNSSRIFTNDTAGNPILIESDFEADGIVNRILEQAFDANGFIVLRRSDFDADGIFDLEQTWAYHPDAPGHWISRSTTDENGVLSFHEEWQFDPNNARREIHIDQDTDGDMIWDVEMFVSWVDDVDGTVTRFLERDLNRDGLIDRTDLRVILNAGEYLPFERQRYSTLYESDTDADGSLELVETRVFDANQRVINYAATRRNAGSIQSQFEFDTTYNEDGNLSSFTNTNGYTIDITYTDWVLGEFDLLNLPDRAW